MDEKLNSLRNNGNNFDDSYFNTNVNTDSSAFDAALANNIEKETKDNSGFEYTSFTPYKPVFDDMDLTNNMFSVGYETGVTVGKASSNEKTEKYEKHKVNSNVKKSRVGNYEMTDVYASSFDKNEFPVFKVIVIAFACLSIALLAAEVYVEYKEYSMKNMLFNGINLLFGVSILLYTIKNDQNYKKITGVLAIAVLVLDIVLVGFTSYSDNLYNLLQSEDMSGKMNSLMLLIALFIEYLFYIVSAIYIFSTSKIIKFATFIGIISSILMTLSVMFSVSTGNTKLYFDIIPAALPMVFAMVALTFANYNDSKQ